MSVKLIKITLTTAILLHQLWPAFSQDMIRLPLPLGRFGFVARNPFLDTSTTTQSPVVNGPFDRPQVDTSVPVGVDIARIRAEEAANFAFINACPRQMILAYLRCPCGDPGKRCADPYSVCSLENKCICNGKFAYPDTTGKVCIPYVTRTTTTTTTTTTKPTSTSTTTISTTTSTTPIPTRVFTITKPAEAEKPCPDVPPIVISASERIEFHSIGYPGTTGVDLECDVAEFKPPAGKKLKVEFVEFQLAGGPAEGGCAYPNIALVATKYEEYCTGGRSPPPSVTFPTDLAVGLGFDVITLPSPSYRYKFNIRFSVVD